MQLEQIKEQLIQQFNESQERTIMLKGAVQAIDVAIQERDNPTPEPEETPEETTEE
jgi:hypothetical protein